MPHNGSKIFLRLPGGSKNPVLHPATVVQVASSTQFGVLPEDTTLAIEVGLELMIYFDFGGKFVQQPARIEALPDEASQDTEGEGVDGVTGITLKTIGDFVSAENRQTYRVCTVMSNLDVTFDGETGCPLSDISATGFAVVTSAGQKYQVGKLVDAELPYEGKTYVGHVSIQSVREMPDGRVRYGVNCVKDDGSSASLSKGVRIVSMGEQRQQLARISRSA